MKASEKIAENYKAKVNKYGPFDETYKEITTGRNRENSVYIPVKLLNELLEEKEVKPIKSKSAFHRIEKFILNNECKQCKGTGLYPETVYCEICGGSGFALPEKHLDANELQNLLGELGIQFLRRKNLIVAAIPSLSGENFYEVHIYFDSRYNITEIKIDDQGEYRT